MFSFSAPTESKALCLLVQYVQEDFCCFTDNIRSYAGLTHSCYNVNILIKLKANTEVD